MGIEELLEIIGKYLGNGLKYEDYQYFYNLLEKRTIILNEEINQSILEKVILPLQEFERDDSSEPVNLILNTQGGFLSDGVVLCDIIDKYSKPLNIYVIGYAYSLGAIILCAGHDNSKVKKYCYNFSTCLFHPGSLKMEGDANSVRDTMEFNNKLDKKIEEYILSHSLIPADLYDKHRDKQWFLDSEEMLKYELVNEIL